MNNRKNFISALILQIITILHGLILPRVIIGTFGSDVNGLVSSITQFLSFISLLEGGLGAVVLAELYKPIEDRNDEQIRQIVSACQNFFRKLGLLFVAYVVGLAVIYPLLFVTEFKFTYVSTLILILSVSTFVQYMFAITNKLLLQAQQKLYIVNFITSLTLILNLSLALIIIFYFPNIHLVKLVSSLIFLIQPFVYDSLVERKFKKNLKGVVSNDAQPLKNRWDGFAQNLAHFVNMNISTVLITIFLSLSDVSVYAVYMLAMNALRSLISNVANSYQSALGKYYAENDLNNLKRRFSQFEKSNFCISTVLFTTCLLLINPFVKLYTTGVTDANYYSPYFAVIMVFAVLLYCIREPYRLLVLAAGKFKETTFGAVMEAVITLTVSLVLVVTIGLPGIAIGAFCGITYRLLYFVRFLKKEVLYAGYRRYIQQILCFTIVGVLNLVLYRTLDVTASNYFVFCIYGVIIVIAEFVIYIGIYYAVSMISKLATRKHA